MKEQLDIHHADELLRLARGLPTVKHEDFDIDCWHCNVLEGEDLYHCGTVACAIGWLPKIVPETEITLKVDPNFPTLGLEPRYGYYKGFEAVEKYFNLPNDVVMEVFTTSGYASSDPRPSTVARRILNLLKENGYATY